MFNLLIWQQTNVFDGSLIGIKCFSHLKDIQSVFEFEPWKFLLQSAQHFVFKQTIKRWETGEFRLVGKLFECFSWLGHLALFYLMSLVAHLRQKKLEKCRLALLNYLLFNLQANQICMKLRRSLCLARVPMKLFLCVGILHGRKFCSYLNFAASIFAIFLCKCLNDWSI